MLAALYMEIVLFVLPYDVSNESSYAIFSTVFHYFMHFTISFLCIISLLTWWFKHIYFNTFYIMDTITCNERKDGYRSVNLI